MEAPETLNNPYLKIEIKFDHYPPVHTPWKFKNKVAEFGRLAMWSIYVKSYSIKKHLTHNGKQMIWVFSLTQKGYKFTSGLWSHSEGGGGGTWISFW